LLVVYYFLEANVMNLLHKFSKIHQANFDRAMNFQSDAKLLLRFFINFVLKFFHGSLHKEQSFAFVVNFIFGDVSFFFLMARIDH